MTLYPDRPERPRVAVFARYDFPRADGAALYERLDALAAALGVEHRVLHSIVGDPGTVPPPVRARLGTGLLVASWPAQHGNDVAHCRSTLPQRCDELLAAMARFAGGDAAHHLERAEVREAFAFARQVCAWGASAVVSFGLDEGALQAFVAAALLDLPHVLLLPDAHGQHSYGQLLPLYAGGAHTIVALGREVASAVAARLPAALHARIVAAGNGDVAGPAVRAAIASTLARPRAASAPALGPAAAFVTRAVTPPSCRGRRFVVLGTERTGSNLLVGMLGARPGFACAGELFNADAITNGELFWLPGGAPDAAALVRLRAADPAALLARLYAAGDERGAEWTGSKLLYLQAELDDRIVNAFAGDRALAVVHLLRQDRLGRLLSFARARATDQWFTAAGAAVLPADSAPLTLDARAIATEFTWTAQQEERCRATFRRHAVLELDYDDLAHRLPDAGRRLGAFFGRDLGPLVPTSRKTGPRDVRTAITNYAELKSVFAGTRFAEQFPGD